MVQMEDAYIEGNVTTASKLWSTFFKPVLCLVPAWTQLYLLHPFDISWYYISEFDISFSTTVISPTLYLYFLALLKWLSAFIG